MTTQTIFEYTSLAVNAVLGITLVACMTVTGYGLVLLFWRRVTAQKLAAEEAVAEEKAAS